MIAELKSRISQCMLHNKQQSLTSSLSTIYTVVDALEQQFILAETLGQVVEVVDGHFKDEEIGKVVVIFEKEGREDKISQAKVVVNNY